MGSARSGCLTASMGGRGLLSTVLTLLTDLHSGLLSKAERQSGRQTDPFGSQLEGASLQLALLAGWEGLQNSRHLA